MTKLPIYFYKLMVYNKPMKTIKYLYPTPNGYKTVTRRVGLRKKTVKKQKLTLIDRLFPIYLLAFTVSMSFGVHYGSLLRDVKAYEFHNPQVYSEFGIIQEVEKPEIEWKDGLATSYSCGGLKTEAEIKMNCPSLLSGKPKTANGTEPLANKTMACDRSNMGRTFFIEGLGERVCTDTGGSIKGAGRFDLYLEDVQEARLFGKQTVRYYEVKEK